MVRRLISVELFLKISSQKTAGSIPASLITFFFLEKIYIYIFFEKSPSYLLYSSLLSDNKSVNPWK